MATKSAASVPVPGLQQQIPPSEYAALVDLYTSTAGQNWYVNDGWNDPTSSSWFGVIVSGFDFDQTTGQVLSIGHVTELYLQDDNLSGSIPDSLGNLGSLQVLFFHMNQLTGTIPTTLGNLVNLKSLTLESNLLSGNIPESLGNLVNVEWLNLNGIAHYIWNNEFTGTIPTSFGNLANVRMLDLSGNRLTGSIPESLSHLPKLTSLGLGENQLTGSIPESLGRLNLDALYLSDNQLTGTIPTTLGNLVHLRTLSLRGNQLTGSIPESFSNLTELFLLYLAGNRLSGNIPDFAAFSAMDTCDISYNCFDISPGSEVMMVVERMRQAGTSVFHAPQNPDCAPAAPGDLNYDGCVDRSDLSLLMSQIRARSSDLTYDLNGDGKIDVADARFLVMHFTNPGGSPCPP